MIYRSPYPRMSLAELILERARERGDRIALVDARRAPGSDRNS